MKDELTQGSEKISNPVMWACWSDEDFVGRIARLSRRVAANRLVVLRVMTRSLMQYARHFGKV